MLDIVYASLLAFVLGTVIALAYVRSFNGLTYSRAFLQSLIFAPLLTAVAMQAIGDNVARGLGLVGAFSLLRFRTNIKDTRDMMFMFASLSVGLACGVYSYPIAVVSTVFFVLAVIFVHNVPFTVETDYDAVLRVQIDNDDSAQVSLNEILKRNSRRFSLLAMREMAQGDRLDVSYQIKMANDLARGKIVGEIGKIRNTSDIHLFMQDQANEI
jgi:uncharacterized membrane protein YhiD involved in acid resistance